MFLEFFRIDFDFFAKRKKEGFFLKRQNDSCLYFFCSWFKGRAKGIEKESESSVLLENKGFYITRIDSKKSGAGESVSRVL